MTRDRLALLDPEDDAAVDGFLAALGVPVSVGDRGGAQDWTKGKGGLFTGSRPSGSGQWKTAGRPMSGDERPADLTGDEDVAVTAWVTSYDRMHDMQRVLQGGTSPVETPTDRDAQAFVSALKKSPRLEGMVMRGVSMQGASVEESERFWTEKIGQSFKQGTYWSTSTVREVAATYAEPVLMRIRGAVSRDITWKLAELGEPKFRETIIGPGWFKVTGVQRATVRDSFYERDRKRQVVVVDVERVAK